MLEQLKQTAIDRQQLITTWADSHPYMGYPPLTLD